MYYHLIDILFTFHLSFYLLVQNYTKKFFYFIYVVIIVCVFNVYWKLVVSENLFWICFFFNMF